MSLNSEFVYDAPKYHDFTSVIDDKDVDRFFDIDHEVTSTTEDSLLSHTVIKKEVISPEVQPNLESEDMTEKEAQNSTPRVTRRLSKGHRRLTSNLSVSTIPSHNMEDLLNQALGNISVKKEKKPRTLFEGISLSVPAKKNQGTITRNDQSTMIPKTLDLRSHSVVKNEVEIQCLDNLSLKKGKKPRTLFEGISLSVPAEKSHKMITRKDKATKTPTLDLRSHSIVRNEVKLENRKRQGSPMQDCSQAKYMGMAERIMHFERDTPPRFHSKRRSGKFEKQHFAKSRKTIAITPNLSTMHRNRPVSVLSQEEREKLELEEMKKNQIKAVPLKKSILEEPSIPPKPEPKPLTMPCPFNLTELVKKPVIKDDGKPFQFTANPVPKNVSGPSVVRVPVLKASDSTLFLNQKEVPMQGIKIHRNNVKKYTEPQPFSFEERNKQMFKRKEEKIKEFLEEEKRAREFHANPVPPMIVKQKDSSKMLEKENIKIIEDVKPFKAQPATVLHKAPFEPKKPERSLLHLPEIELNTERRAKEREEFDLKIKQKEQILERLKRQRELERRKTEEEEIAELRKAATHKAIPVPNFKPMIVKASEIPLTEPLSPCFSKKPKRCTKN